MFLSWEIEARIWNIQQTSQDSFSTQPSIWYFFFFCLCCIALAYSNREWLSLQSGSDQWGQAGLLMEREGVRDSDSERQTPVHSWDRSKRGQDYLLTVFGVQGENKLLLISGPFAVKCLFCLWSDCGLRIISFNMYLHLSQAFFTDCIPGTSWYSALQSCV